MPVAAYVLASSMIAAIAVATARETYRVPMAELDQLAPVASPRPVAAQRGRARASVG